MQRDRKDRDRSPDHHSQTHTRSALPPTRWGQAGWNDRFNFAWPKSDMKPLEQPRTSVKAAPQRREWRSEIA
jgi:hypothetical protein